MRAWPTGYIIGADSNLKTTKIKGRCNKMVDLTKQPNQAISVQAGPGDAASRTTTIRLHEDSVKALGQRLASIGDHLQQEWPRKHRNRRPAVLHFLRPARALTRAILRDINSHVWELRSLSATTKAWVLSTMTEHRGFQLQNWRHLVPAVSSGWTKGAAAAAAVALCWTIWIEWKT